MENKHKQKNISANKVKSGDVKFHFKIKHVMIILLFAGLIFFMISFIWSKTNIDDIKIKDQFLNKIFESAGLTLISASLVSLLLETSSIQTAVNNAIEQTTKNVLNLDFPLSNYSIETLKELNNKIACEISENNMDINEFKNSIYSIEERLIKATNNLYYEYHESECHIKVENRYFIKSVHVKYKVVNTNNFENIVRVILSLFDYKPNMTNEERKASIDIERLIVNGKNLTDELRNSLSISSEENPYRREYDYRAIFERKLQGCKNHIVEIKYTYKSPIRDKIHSYKIVYPCKKLKHKICFNNQTDRWNLIGVGFTSFYCTTFDTNNYHIDQSVGNAIDIIYDDWILPGAGYSVTIDKINN